MHFLWNGIKKVKRKEVHLRKCDYDGPENTVKEAALALQDSIMLATTGDIGFHEREVHHHHECKRENLNKGRAATVDPTHSTRNQAETNALQSLVYYSVIRAR